MAVNPAYYSILILKRDAKNHDHSKDNGHRADLHDQIDIEGYVDGLLDKHITSLFSNKPKPTSSNSQLEPNNEASHAIEK